MHSLARRVSNQVLGQSCDNFKMPNHRGLLLLIFAALTQLMCASMHSYDIVVYDASSAGVIAAVAAARHLQKIYGNAKGRVALLCASWPSCWDEGGRRVGGTSDYAHSADEIDCKLCTSILWDNVKFNTSLFKACHLEVWDRLTSVTKM